MATQAVAKPKAKFKVEFSQNEHDFFKEFLEDFMALESASQKQSFINGTVVPALRTRWPDKFSRAITDGSRNNKVIFGRVKKVIIVNISIFIQN